MNEGYQVIEPAHLSPLFGNPKCFDLAVLVLQWIAREANAHFAEEGAIFEVIKVEYAGAYPAIGVRGAFPDDAEVVVNRLVNEFLRSKTIDDLSAYAVASGIDWRQHAMNILGK